MPVPVCWENDADENKARDKRLKEIVRQAVSNTWEAISGIKFTGWGDCKEGSSGVRIYWNDDLRPCNQEKPETCDDAGLYDKEYKPRPRTNAFGCNMDGDNHGVFLNPTFNNWGYNTCHSIPETCIRNIAVHEFGHVLGFEDVNKDVTLENQDEKCVGSKRGIDSIMNYCDIDLADPNNWILREEDIEMAQEVYGLSSGNGNGNGNYNPPDPYDPWEGYKNAVGIDSVRGSEEGEDDWEYVIEVPLDDIYDMDFRVKLKRKGGVWPDEVEASFYLSEDDIFDSGDVFLGSEDKDLSDEAEKRRSVYVNDVDMADFINEPGEYYVYVAVAYGTGTNRSTSRDKKERVKIIVTNETPLSDGTIVWSPDGPVAGMTCTQWKEPSDPHSWGDNFLCTTRSEDIRWSADGPIAGMRCTQIYESRDPHFNNNYLCVPNESALNFVWSESGNMSDMYCVRTDEPKDKHSWDDNYLCWSDSGANGAGNSGIYYGSYDTVTTNTGATSPDVLPASIHLNDASGNVRAIYTPAEVPGLPDIAVRIENIGAVPSSSEQKHKLKTSVFLTGPGYESGWKFSNTQTKISGFGTPGYAENIAFALPGDAVLNEGLYSITVSTDDTDKLIENNELNNTSPQVMFWVQNALPDIAVQTLSVDDDLTEVEAGSKHDITIDVSNIAPVGGDAHFPVVVQLWYDGDQLLGEQVIEAADLIAGGSNEVTISGWTVPFEEGAHTLTATATNKYVPYEANLSNNSLSQDITIIVTPGDPDCVILNPMEALPATGGFDLAANAISFPDTLKWGESLHPWAEQCVISGRSPETRAMWAYARCDGTGFTPFDDDGNDGMKAGQCGAEQVWTDENLSTMDPGMYMIYFISNGTTQIPESDYSNNVQAKAFLLEE